MNKRLLGRTNQRLYPLWIWGILRDPSKSAQEQAEHHFMRLLQSPYEVLDITPAPALWGQLIREHPTELKVAITAPSDLLQVASYSLAVHSVQAHLVEIFCAIGRDSVDFYFLNLSEAVSESILSGALEALEMARQEGQIRALGLTTTAEPFRVLSLWRTHDAFEVIRLPQDLMMREVLIPEARARRVGVVLEWDAIEPSSAERVLTETGADALLIPPP